MILRFAPGLELVLHQLKSQATAGPEKRLPSYSGEKALPWVCRVQLPSVPLGTMSWAGVRCGLCFLARSLPLWPWASLHFIPLVPWAGWSLEAISALESALCIAGPRLCGSVLSVSTAVVLQDTVKAQAEGPQHMLSSPEGGTEQVAGQ